MLSVTPGSCCDVCAEEFAAALLPHSLPCGHLLCAPCCYGILDHPTANSLCPFCRAPFGGENIRKLRVDFNADEAPAHSLPRSGAPRRPVPVPAPAGATEHGAFCDMCSSQIVGDRYKCVDCPDYDSCASCFVIVPEHHPTHVFVRVRRQEDYIRPARLPAPQRHDTTCTECGRPIEGVRFGCTHSNCEHVSICAPCEAHPIPSHPRGHALVKYRVPGVHPDTRGDRSSAMAAGPRHPAGCDSCGQPIFGVRYKCMHQLCPDFDLCAACEADVAPRHPVDHPMLKVKVPGSPIPDVPRVLHRLGFAMAL